MSKASALPKELEFIALINLDRAEEYRSAWWLKSPFPNNSWELDFGLGSKFQIDFRVQLEDNSWLTDPQHHQLLELFKCWLCVQTHFDSTGQVTLTNIACYHRVSRTFRLIDYFLLNTAYFKLASYGLAIVTDTDIRRFFSDLATSSSTAESIYRWHDRLTAYLKDGISKLNESEVQAILKEKPALGEIEVDICDRSLELNDQELIRARAFLWSKGFYKKACANVDYRYGPRSKQISDAVYANTLWGKIQAKPIPEELHFHQIDRYYREYSSVPVRTALEDKLSLATLSAWKQTLRSMGLLSELELPVPLEALNLTDEIALHDCLPLKPSGRFRTLPQSLVFTSLKQAIEFSLEYGEDLITSYLNIATAAKASDKSIWDYCAQNGIKPLLTEKLRRQGVRTLHLGFEMSFSESNPNKPGSIRPPSSEYFRRMRANEGFFELLHVLYGAIEVSVGTLSARRQGELIDLKTAQCLDQSRQYLVFENRKSGFDGMRQKEVRPIPEICASQIGMLERLQIELVERGIIGETTQLFARPKVPSYLPSSVSHSYYNAALDMFCDYFELALDEKGRRYYIRQHQLRRFFAMLFFWGRSFGGIETLQWYLGHTDMEHLYHYITESTSGAVLNGAKAAYGAEALRREPAETGGLAQLARKHFNVEKFSLLDSEELEEYVFFLLESGTVTIEPHFFQTPEGKEFKVMVKITGEINEN
ncbi:hypothetical protein EDC30_103195 [Paucimonas lemoignei]|uniref:Phage integrase family protein n=1 Tax=Paucimonas lemoignei TaxID=29443 RepID=A0A4R3HYZ5_PAULE|nr:site-specific integrase [Paucimonas lemoignei]TCS37903.1 hypothetical protein EDC30_103195 [Paucimonas lemoignei]